MDYNTKSEKKTVIVKDANKEEFRTFFEQMDVDYLLFINQYEINRMGEPFNTNFHIINYNIFSKNAEILYTGNTFFESPNIVPLNKINRKFKKASAKIIQKTEKILSSL